MGERPHPTLRVNAARLANPSHVVHSEAGTLGLKPSSTPPESLWPTRCGDQCWFVLLVQTTPLRSALLSRWLTIGAKPVLPSVRKV